MDYAQFKQTMSHEDAQAFCDTQFRAQIGWYEKEAFGAFSRAEFWTKVGIGFGFLSTIIAALPITIFIPKDATVETAVNIMEASRWVIVFVSAIASVATGMLVPRSRRLAEIREKGRLKSTLLEKVAFISLTNIPMTQGEKAAVQLDYVRQLMAIEEEHGGLAERSSAGSEEGTK